MIDDVMEMLVIVMLPFAQIAAGIVLVTLLLILILATIWRAIGLGEGD